MKMRLFVQLAAICCAAFIFWHAGHAQPQMRQLTHIAAQPLGPALKELAASRRLQVLYLSAMVQGLQTQGVTGDLSTDEAFDRLLRGTGLAHRFVDTTTVSVFKVLHRSGTIVAHDTPPAVAQPPQPLPQVLITGEQPGPGLWKVTSGQHVLWILGAPPTPLPPGLVWRSKQVKAVLARAQEVILDGHIVFDANRTLGEGGLQPTEYFQERRLPYPQTLKDVVPEDLYHRFTALKSTFAAKDRELEHLRPWLAASELRKHVLTSLGLTETTIPTIVVRDASLRAELIKVITYANYSEFERTSKSSRTVSCLEKTVAELETDRDNLKRLANAWSVGDIAELRKLLQRQGPDNCLSVMFDSEQRATEAVTQHTQGWLAAVELALRTRQTSFALVPMVKVLAPDGWITALRAHGYVVEDPQ
jgi:hypothetical protein